MQLHGRDLRKGRVSVPNQIYVVTAVTCERMPVFSEWESASVACRQLARIDESETIRTLAWVVMPDHVHWLLELKAGELHAPVRRMKSVIARSLGCGAIWQRGFHDRAIRQEDDIVSIARYIVANPVRAGLVRRVGNYPFWNAVWL